MKSNSIQSFRNENPSIQRSVLKGGGNKSPRAWLVLFLFALALQIFTVWNLELSGPDSPRVAGIAREMAITSNYLIPRLNGEDFLEYPPLGYWPVALALSVSQKPPDFLAFLPIVFFGTGTILLTYLIGKRLAGERIGLMAGFILSTMPGFVNLHRHCWVDPVLLFFVTLSLYGLAVGYRTSKKRFLFSAIFYLAMAAAFLSKGLIGVAIPAATAVVFLITQKDLTAIRKLLLSPGVFLFFLPILFWVGSVWQLEDLGIFEEVIRQSLWRFFSSSADHTRPFYSYFIPTFLHLMPWFFLPLVLLWYRWGPTRSREPLDHGSLLWFAIVWFLTVFIGLSLASAKRPIYLGPLYPPFALLAALGWDHIREKFTTVKRGEIYGLTVIFLVYIGTYLLFITPSEREQGLRPIFEAVSSQRPSGPVYLVNPSEALRGASFFYLGKRTPVLDEQDLLLGRVGDQSGTTFVIYSYCDNNQLLSHLRLKGYRLLLQKRFKKTGVCVYSNGSSFHSMALLYARRC